jgi:hypothetical protein
MATDLQSVPVVRLGTSPLHTIYDLPFTKFTARKRKW